MSRPPIPSVAIYNSDTATVAIHLTQGHITTVDEADMDLAERKWQAQYSRHGSFYATRVECVKRKRTVLRMHILILERKLGSNIPEGYRCDHADGNTLNNRRENLRLANFLENARNARIRIDNTSGIRGISFHKVTSKWQASISVSGVQSYLGLFDTLEQAAAARTQAELIHFGEFSPLVCRGE